jgi:hypothetical protein
MRPEEDVGPPVVKITGLWSKFGRTVVHQDLNLEIYAGVSRPSIWRSSCNACATTGACCSSRARCIRR